MDPIKEQEDRLLRDHQNAVMARSHPMEQFNERGLDDGWH
jgi:hypothetical protein